MRRHLSIVVVLAVCMPPPVSAQMNCWCCSYGPAPQSLIRIFADADAVVVGSLQNAVESDNAAPSGQTEFVFDEVLKAHKSLQGKKSMTIPRFLPAKGKFLIAFEDLKSSRRELEPFHGVELDANGAVLKYIKGGLKLKDQSSFAQLKYNVDFLRDPNAQIANSALTEFNTASYADIRKLGAAMKPEPLAQALTAADTPAHNRAAFAMLLAHCGRAEDAITIRKLIDNGDMDKNGSVLASLLFAYAVLERNVGWDLIVKHSQLPGDGSFLKRYQSLQAVRRLWAERKDIVAKKQWDDFMLGILAHKDMADFAIEDFRKAKQWDHCDRVLEIFDVKNFSAPIIRRCVLRYALQCPSPKAAAFVAAQRVRDREWVEETKELLDLE